MNSQHTLAPSRLLLNKVPEVTVYFWVVKVLCTTVGETAADFLNVNLNFGLTGTSIVTGVLLIFALLFQFGATRYLPIRYWTAVALVSVFGTLVTDNLTDKVGLPLEASTVVFSVLLAATFLLWYRSERTLSIHSIVTPRRESFYWAAILFTFALGTATGDLMAEVLGLGYAVTGIIVASLIALIAVSWRFGLDAVLSFWMIYILTRPLGASIGDYLSQPASQGGLGLGATVTSIIFVLGIVGIVTYLAMTRADVTPNARDAGTDTPTGRGGLWQTVVVVALVLVTGVAGYSLRKSSIQHEISDPATVAQSNTSSSRAVPLSPLGDLSTFRTITQDTLDRVRAGDQSGATDRVGDLESEWDRSEARLKPRDKAEWTKIDDKIDAVLRELRATNPKPDGEKAALSSLLATLT